MQRPTSRELETARRVAEAVVEFLVARDEARARQPARPEPAPVPITSKGEPIDPPEEDPGQLVDVDRVAELLQCSVRNVTKLAAEGVIPRHRKIGRLTRWSLSELRKWVEDGCPRAR